MIKNNYAVSIIFFLFCYLPELFSQEHIIVLNPQGEIEILGRNFYIEKVVDDRIDKTTIGAVDVGILNKSVSANFPDSLTGIILDYYNVIAPKRENMTPLIMRVKTFEISEYRKMKEYGKVVLRAQLFTINESKQQLVLDTICIKEESTNGDITSSHPSHIRSVLNRVLIAYNKQLLNSNATSFKDLDSLKENRLLSSKNEDLKAKTSSKSDKIISFSYLAGINANAYRYNLYWIPYNSQKRWSFSIILGGEIVRLHDDFMLQSPYSSYKAFVINLGIASFYKINDSFLIGLNSHFPIGSETVGISSSNFMAGISPSQMIYFKSKSKRGIIAGIGIFEKVSTSVIYNQDFGARIELGFKF